MINKTITLSDKYPNCTLTTYVCDNDPFMKMPPRRAMIVCPGGGYRMLAPHEGEPIVRQYLAAEMNVYLLHYTLNEEAVDYAPLIQAALAIKYVREHAKEHNTDPEKIFICGFSAGGHLAASSGILWNSAPVRAALGIDEGKAPEGINRPNGMVLCYPVISGGEFRHKGSFCKLTGKDDPTDEDREPFWLEHHIDSTTPPVFVWHTNTDRSVPIQNSIILMGALAANKVPFEAHIYPEGVHGLSLGTVETSCQNPDNIVEHLQTWMGLSIRWIKTI